MLNEEIPQLALGNMEAPFPGAAGPIYTFYIK